MSNLQLAPSSDETCLERKLDVSADVSPDLRPEGTKKIHSFKGIDIGESKTMKLSARDLLEALSGRRISITKIKFFQNDAGNGGTFADVAVATLFRTGDGYKGGRKVAVKKLRLIINSDMTEEKFLRVFVNEFRLLDKLSHPNVVGIIGFVENIKNRIAWLVFPWEENGNLREFLRSGDWEIPERVSLISDVTSGLEYLHTRQPPICHGDLKSLNILVNLLNHALITDFGSARAIREAQEPRVYPTSHPTAPASQALPKQQNEHPGFNISISNTVLTLTGPACSLRWAPPEFFHENLLDLASDIWALGWIGWEAITDRYPFEEVDLEVQVSEKIMECQLPPIYDHQQLSQIYQLCSVMQSCWNPDPKGRPTATECQKAIQWIPYAVPAPKSGEESATLSLKIGEMHRLQNRHQEAAKMYERGLVIARSTGDQTTEANLLVSRGHNHRARSKHTEAETSFTQALAIFEGTGNACGRAIALDGIGLSQRERGNYVEAEVLYTRTLSIFKSIGNGLGQVNALLGLGDVQRARSNYVEAEATYNELLTICKSMEDHLSQANGLYGLGNVQRECSKYAEAEASYTQALSLYKRIGDDRGRANSSLGLARTRLQQGRKADARALVEDAARISEQLDYPWGKETSKRLLEDVLEAERALGEPGPSNPRNATDVEGNNPPGPLPAPDPLARHLERTIIFFSSKLLFILCLADIVGFIVGSTLHGTHRGILLPLILISIAPQVDFVLRFILALLRALER